MRDFNFYEWVYNPEQKLLIEEYRTDCEKPQVWEVKDAKRVFDDYIVIRIDPNVGDSYNISEVTVVYRTGIVYHNRGEQIGTLKFIKNQKRMKTTYKNLAEFIRQNKDTMLIGETYYDKEHGELYQIFTLQHFVNAEMGEKEDGIATSPIFSTLLLEVDGIKYMVTQK